MANDIQLPNAFVKCVKEPFKFKGKRILVISDIHIPYHNVEALNLALEYGKQKKADSIVILGDFLDMYQISRFSRSPENPSVAEEVKLGVQVLKYIRKKFPNVEMTFVEGNHDLRMSNYVQANSELFGLEAIKLENLLKLKDFGITYINEKRFLKAGKLILAHGHELGLSTGGVNPSRTVLLKTFSNVLFGHFHKTSEYITSKLDGEMLGCWSIGHLSDPSPYYMPVNQWNWGFAFLEVQASGDFKVHNMKIYNGKVL